MLGDHGALAVKTRMTLEILKKREDFLKLNKARRWTAHGLVLQAADNDLGRMRIGFTVTKKLSPSAVKRNRIKRRLREAARLTMPLYAKEGCDYVLLGRPGTATRPFEALCQDIRWCLEKMGYAKNSD